MRSRAVLRTSRSAIGAVLAACILFLTLLPAAAAGEAAPGAGAIVVEGNKRIEAATIRSYFAPRAGAQGAADRTLDAKAIDAGLKALYASGLFTDAKISHDGDRLIVTVVEAPMIDRISFEGNQALDDKRLTPELQSKVRGGLIRATVQADVERLTELYRHNGHFDVRVVPQTVAHGRDRVDLVFAITEGGKTTVKRIDFVGNRAFAAWRLKGVIKTGQANLLSFLTGSDLYDPDKVEADRDLLRAFYLDRGYVDVGVAPARAELDPALKGIVVTYSIDEGAPYRFGKVDVDSHIPQVDGHALAATLETRHGDTYDAALVEKTVDDLAITLAKRGFPFAVVHVRGAPDPQTHTLDLVYAVDPGARRYVERIDIRGNDKTRDWVIRREFDIAEGDAYNRVLIDRAERRLKALDYFKSVKITTAPGSEPDRVVVNVAVVEQQTGNFSFGVGYSTVDGVVGNVTIGERNFLGLGQTVKLALALGEYTNSVDIGFVQPDILGSRVSLGLDIFGKQSLESTYQSYGSASYGTSVKLGLPITDDLSAQVRYSIFNQSVSIDPSLVTGTISLPIQQAAAAGPAWVSMVGYGLAYDTRDDKKSPTSGLSAQFNQDIAGLGGDVNFIKTTEDARYYHEITDGVVGMVRAQSGLLTPWGGQSVPLLNRFFGGPQLVRGFAPSGFGPRDLTPGSTMDNIGGTAFWGTTAETQAAIPYLPSDFNLKVAVFADAGSVWSSGGIGSLPSLSQNFTLGNSSVIRSSFGAGLIWGSPFGPIRLDYAYPVSKASYDVTQRLSFSAGGF
ncbi:MAG TPA: outer membrane protein assembly factor BamA [Xanthobacteraceae bacterium]